MTWRAAALVCGVLGATASTAAMQPTLDRRGIEEAVQAGQARFDAERTRLHNTYRLSVSKPPVDWIDVLTPFYRVALAAEARARLGDRVFGQREALAVLNTAPELFEIVFELTFNPLNTYVGVPNYQVTLRRGQEKPIAAQNLNRYPRFGPRTHSTPALPNPNAAPVLGQGESISGGTLIAQFGVDAVDPNGRYDIVITDGNQEVVRTAVDFGKMR